jgi:uncharacterized protein (TIGR02145 family)
MDEILLGNKIWMSKNLSVTQFRNGDEIPTIFNILDWEMAGNEGKPACCYFENDETYAMQFGILYNWHAVEDIRELAPEGWRIPTLEDYMDLIESVGGEARAGHFLKSKTGWTEGNGLDKFNFKMLPGGMRGGDGFFSGDGFESDFWLRAYNHSECVCFSADQLDIMHSQSYKGNGHYVRCVKDL